MAFSLLVNIMNACFFARQSGGGGWGGYVKNQGCSGGAEIDADARNFNGALFSLEAVRAAEATR